MSPDKVRWEYREPYKYIIILNEGKLNLKSESNENEIDMRSNAIFGEINALMISAVSGNIFNNPDYKIEAYESNQYFKVVLKPLSSTISQMIEQMELYFNKENYSVNRIKMIEPSSDYSEFRFIHQKFNEPIPENTFNL
jgi:outer membrane lipoprotein carrier protein